MSTNLAENKQKVLPDARNVTVRAKSALSGRENMSKIGVEYAISPRKHRKLAISRHMNGVAGIAGKTVCYARLCEMNQDVQFRLGLRVQAGAVKITDADYTATATLVEAASTLILHDEIMPISSRE